MSAQFSVLVKLDDEVNDNDASKFVGIESLDWTLLCTDFVQSTRLNPVLKIRAVDADLNECLYTMGDLDYEQKPNYTLIV